MLFISVIEKTLNTLHLNNCTLKEMFHNTWNVPFEQLIMKGNLFQDNQENRTKVAQEKTVEGNKKKRLILSEPILGILIEL